MILLWYEKTCNETVKFCLVWAFWHQLHRTSFLYPQEAHVNTCYKHFYYFVTEYNLVDKKELEPLVSDWGGKYSYKSNTLFWLFKNACKCCKSKILCMWLIAMILWSTSFLEYSVIYHKGTQHLKTLKS